MFKFILFIQIAGVFILLIETCYIIWKCKNSMHKILLLNCLATLINNGGYLMEIISTTRHEYMIGLRVSYIGRVWIAFTLFLFVIKLCKINFPKMAIAILSVFNVGVVAMVYTSDYHNLYYTWSEYITDSVFSYVKFGHGVFHHIYMCTLVFFVVYGLFLLFRTISREKIIRTKKILKMVAYALFVESAFFLVSLLGLTAAYDLTAIGYLFGTLIMSCAIFKHGLLDALEIAKDFAMDEISEGIIVFDNNGHIEYYNRQAQNIFGDVATGIEECDDAIRRSIAEDVPFEYNDRVYAIKDKQLIQNDMSEGIVRMFIDETRHFSYIHKIEQQKKIAEEANASKSLFVSVVSHEIRTPMNAVVGMTELLLMDRDKLDDRQLKYLNNIKNSGEALVMIVNDILDQSKIEAGKMEIIVDDYNIRSLIEDVRMIIENRIGSKSIKVITRVDDEVPQVLVGDGLRIRQIIINLMNNSAKFTEKGFVELDITVTEKKENEIMLKFSIKDSGQGIRPEELEKLGNAFAQADTKKNHNKEGTGLGLSISKNFISMMGGELKVASEYGKGSEFYFEISQGIGNGNSNPRRNTEFVAPEAKVLVVDDTELNLMLMEELLACMEMNVETAKSGVEALKLLKTEKYDLIFMDYMMPEMDGVEATANIRAMEEEYYKNLPIIVLSGDTSEETTSKFKNAGVSDFAEKPVELTKLKQMMIKWLPVEKVQYKQEN